MPGSGGRGGEMDLNGSIQSGPFSKPLRADCVQALSGRLVMETDPVLVLLHSAEEDEHQRKKRNSYRIVVSTRGNHGRP